MNWAFKQAEKQTKQIIDNQGDILFTLPSEKEQEKETARFDLESFKQKSTRKPHARIYSMYNFQNDNQQMNPSPRIEVNKEKIESFSSNNCLICFDKTPDSVFMECGHGGKSLLILYIFIFKCKCLYNSFNMLDQI